MAAKRIITAVFLIIVLSTVMSTSTWATHAGLSAEKLSVEEQEELLSNLCVSAIHAEPERTHSISCFDVNQNGKIALGFDGSNQKQICVYNTDGEFEYGYAFVSDGGFAVAWDDDNLVIYFARGSIVASFDPNAVCLEIAEIPNTVENSAYWTYTLNSTQRTVGDTKYQIRNKMGILNIFAMSYSQLVRVDRDGTEKVIYDVCDWQAAKYITAICTIVLFFTIVILVIVSQFRKNRKKAEM